jgi:hypothetical protein
MSVHIKYTPTVEFIPCSPIKINTQNRERCLLKRKMPVPTWNSGRDGEGGYFKNFSTKPFPVYPELIKIVNFNYNKIIIL